MITVNRLLDKLQPYNIKLLAGEKGMHEKIDYLTIQESHLKSERIRKNGVIMSTLQSFSDTDEVINHIKWLISIDVKAICIHFVILNKISEDIISFCNEVNFPLLTIPKNVPYSDIFNAFNQLLQEDANTTRTEIEDINSNLLKAVASGRGPEFIVKTMSKQLSATIIYLDRLGKVKFIETNNKYKNAEIQTIVEADILRDKDLLKLHTSEEIAVHYIFETNRGDKIPFNLFPIISDDEYYGSLLIEMQPVYSLMEMSIIRHGKTALLLDLARSSALEKYLKNDEMKYLESLFKPAYSVEKKEFHELSHLLKGENIIYVFILESFKELNSTYDYLFRMRPDNSIVWIFNQEVIFITEVELQQNVLEELATRHPNLIVGISEKNLNHSVDEIKKKYTQAKTSIERGKKRGVQINEWRKISFDRILFSSLQSQLLVDESYQVLSTLIEHDNEHNTEFVDTLEVYLDNFFSFKKSAEKMFIHPNTVKYRINKIKSLYQIDDLQNPEVYLSLATSIRLYKLAF